MTALTQLYDWVEANGSLFVSSCIIDAKCWDNIHKAIAEVVAAAVGNICFPSKYIKAKFIRQAKGITVYICWHNIIKYECSASNN